MIIATPRPGVRSLANIPALVGLIRQHHQRELEGTPAAAAQPGNSDDITD
jgi:hypothetical protein